MGGQGAVLVSSFINLTLVSHVVSPAVYGLQAVATTLPLTLDYVVGVGLSQVLFREAIADRSARSPYIGFLWARVVLMAVAAAVGLGVVFVGFDESQRLTGLIGLSILFLNAGSSIQYPVCQLGRDMRSVRRSSLIQAASQLIGTVTLLLLVASPTANQLVLVTAVSCTLASISAAVTIVAKLKALASGSGGLKRFRMVRPAVTFALSGTSGILYAQVDQILLLSMGGAFEAGLYAVAVRCSTVGRFSTRPATVPIGPAATAAIIEDGKVPLELDRAASRYLGLVGIASVAVVSAGAFWFTHLTLAPSFQAATALILILTFHTCWNGLSAYSTNKAISKPGSESSWLIVATAALVLNIGLNAVFIPEFGATAAAVITVVTELFAFGSLSFFAQPHSSVSMFRTVASIVSVSGVMVGSALVLQRFDAYWQQAIVSAAFGLCFALAASRALKTLRGELTERLHARPSVERSDLTMVAAA